MRVAICTLLALAGTAHADERITDDTAYKTPEGKVRAGLWKLQYGVHRVPRLEIGTYTLPYTTWAFGIRTVNVHAKYQFYTGERFTFAASLGVAYVDLSGLDDQTSASIYVVPIQLLGAWQLSERITLGLGLMFSSVSGEGSYNEDENSEFRGAVAVSNAQTWLSMSLRISRGWSLYLETRGISSTEAAASGDYMKQLDDRTTVDVAATGNASIDEMQGASSLLAFQYSAKRFRMRFGVGYGNYNLPMINFIVPKATPFPELDLYWVF
ncbi:MAG: hypothetical protein M4D80_10975 [Myxococcota bacterium]|nr:hypothetical protein [Deltaproteobacteria bacterium]MDQ3335680.1 hypothetical protein [Myxococcota bacterium]